MVLVFAGMVTGRLLLRSLDFEVGDYAGKRQLGVTQP